MNEEQEEKLGKAMQLMDEVLNEWIKDNEDEELQLKLGGCIEHLSEVF
jgi:predicted RNase H-like HicB family nuclease